MERNVNSQDLIACAHKARENAYAPYSNFKVGAALLGSDGKVFTGCNVENATYGLTVCAERVALWKAISEGEREFTAVAVVSTSNPPAPPCGACRQLLWEFCGELEVTTANTQGVTRSYLMTDLLPHAFDRSLL